MPSFSFLVFLGQQAVVTGQGFDAAVIGGFCLFGKEAARHPFIVVPVMGHASTAFAVAGAIIGAGAVSFVVTTHDSLSFFSQI